MFKLLNKCYIEDTDLYTHCLVVTSCFMYVYMIWVALHSNYIMFLCAPKGVNLF